MVPKLETPIDPPRPVDGIDWYFHYPWEAVPPEFCGRHQPCPWLDVNRDTNLDPMLECIREVYQTEWLTNNSKKLQPPGWKRAFQVECMINDQHGGKMIMTISIASFMMNPRWCRNSIIRYIEDEWVIQTKNHKHIGSVLKNAIYTDRSYAEKNPVSPCKLVVQSFLQIADIDEPIREFRRRNDNAEKNAKPDDVMTVEEFRANRGLGELGPSGSVLESFMTRRSAEPDFGMTLAEFRADRSSGSGHLRRSAPY